LYNPRASGNRAGVTGQPARVLYGILAAMAGLRVRSRIRTTCRHVTQSMRRRATKQWLRWHPELGLPIPPLEMRELVGPTDAAAFDNPNLDLVYPYLPQEAYAEVFDFGCGCGRIARQLLQQVPRPRRYVGIDLHRGMIKWCSDNLAPVAPHFEFQHHDVFNLSFNPETDKSRVRPFPVEDRHLRSSTRGLYLRMSRRTQLSTTCISALE
jgi:SAM-dependent methyltransferase